MVHSRVGVVYCWSCWGDARILLVVGGDELAMVLGPDPVVSIATYNMDVCVKILTGTFKAPLPVPRKEQFCAPILEAR